MSDEREEQASRAHEPTTMRLQAVSGAEQIEPVHETRGHVLTKADLATVEALRAGTALLVVLRGPNTGARFLLDDDEVMSGRHPDSDIFLDDVTVSRKHAVFRRDRRAASSSATSARSTAPTSTASSSTRSP